MVSGLRRAFAVHAIDWLEVVLQVVGKTLLKLSSIRALVVVARLIIKIAIKTSSAPHIAAASNTDVQLTINACSLALSDRLRVVQVSRGLLPASIAKSPISSDSPRLRTGQSMLGSAVASPSSSVLLHFVHGCSINLVLLFLAFFIQFLFVSCSWLAFFF